MNTADVHAHRGLANVRDLGGLPVGFGGTTRHGVLLRSNAPHPGDMPPRGLSWPPATVIDLRTDGEGAAFHPLEVDGCAVHRVPLLDPTQMSRNQLPDSLTDLYLDMLNRSGSRLTAIVQLAATARAPLLIHCTLGKDRTGITIAMLLLLAGVPTDEIVGDYARTHQNIAEVKRRLHSLPGFCTEIHHSAVPDHLMAAPAKAVSAVIEVVTAHPDGPDGWASHLGVSSDAIDAWRTRFVQR